MKEESENKVYFIEDADESECKKSKDEVKSQDKTKRNVEPTSAPSTILNKNIERSKPNAGDDNKQQKDRKSEKSSKGIKRHYDQDEYSDDYSTWLPPQNQTGDGRTNLNDKYGY